MNEKAKQPTTYFSLLGLRMDPSKFEVRLRIQKISYILQNVLGKSSFGFSFYIRGPYSRALALEYFTHPNEFMNPKVGEKVSEADRGEIERIKPLILELNVMQLEIIASLIYLRQTSDEETAEKELHRLKPYLKLEDLWSGTTKVKMLFLTEKLRSKLLASMKDKMDDWD